MQGTDGGISTSNLSSAFDCTKEHCFDSLSPPQQPPYLCCLVFSGPNGNSNGTA